MVWAIKKITITLARMAMTEMITLILVMALTEAWLSFWGITRISFQFTSGTSPKYTSIFPAESLYSVTPASAPSTTDATEETGSVSSEIFMAFETFPLSWVQI